MKQAKTERMKAVDDTRTDALCANIPSRTIMIGTKVSKEEEDKLLEFLRHNQDIFAWSKTDLKGGPPIRYRACFKHRPEGEAEAATAKANVRR
jgi:hypothetical protein